MTAQRRMGRAALGRLSSELGDRDWLILRTVHDHRFLTTTHIQAFCFADHTSALSAARICRRVLVRLFDLRVLSRLERRVGGVRAGSASYVWTIGPVGDRLLRQDLDDDAPRRRQREPSTAFLDHRLAVADAHLALWTAARANRFGLDSVQLEPACWRSFIGRSGARETLRPDLHVVTVNADYEDRWFIEVDRGSESLPRLLTKCGQYQAYRRSGIEQASYEVFPLVVWVMDRPARVEQLSRALALAARGASEPSPFRVTTPDGLITLLAGGGAA